LLLRVVEISAAAEAETEQRLRAQHGGLAAVRSTSAIRQRLLHGTNARTVPHRQQRR
jgi:hypothetical protein